MNYTQLALTGLGMVGILLHNLVKLNAIKRSDKEGNVNYIRYLKMEWISIFISFIVIIGMVWTSQEIKELAGAGKWLGIGFIAGGYLAQSLLISFMGKAQKVIDNKVGANDVNSKENV